MSTDRQDFEPNNNLMLMTLACFIIYCYKTNFDTVENNTVVMLGKKKKERKTCIINAFGREKKSRIVKKILPDLCP